MNNNQINDSTDSEFSPQDLTSQLEKQLNESINDNMITLRKLFSNSSDFITKNINLCGHEAVIMYCEGMIDLKLLNPLIIKPMLKYNNNQNNNNDANQLLKWLEDNIVLTTSNNILFTYNEIFTSIMSGNLVILINGVKTALSAEMAGFKSRSISESINEVDIRSPQEAFTEPIKINLTMIRRRIKSPALKFETITLGKKSQTSVTMVYLTDVVNCKLLQCIRNKLSKVNMDILLDSSYLATFLSGTTFSILPEIRYSERPDVVCGKISEGRVAILVDGCPHAIIVPHLFIESFQTMDDYTNRPFFASFMRILRYFSFFISILMPGSYVAISSFHPEMFPQSLLYNVAISQEVTPFPIMIEALIIHLIYELMREAGIRLPKQIGYAVSIVGALVIGESAVSSGIIGAPMVIIVALTAITSFIMTPMYQSVCILKFAFIILGGISGLYGLTLGFCCLILNITSIKEFSIPYTSPISPFNKYFMRDTFIRRNWNYMGKKNIKIQNMPGTKQYLNKQNANN